MTSFNNVALFIKRAEEYQTKEFIMEVFSLHKIGKVRDIKFIKKNNGGKSYNGAIIIFEMWNSNSVVKSLFDKMLASNDGTTKFYFDNTRYWIINIHQQKLPECEELIIVDSSLPDKEKIKQLEDLVKSMSSQIYYMQRIQELNEMSMMDNERKITQQHLYNVELQIQIDEKDMEKRCAEDDFKEEINKLKRENQQLRCRLPFLAINMSGKENECEQLRQEVRDQNCIMSYMENQVKDMQYMLNISDAESYDIY